MLKHFRRIQRILCTLVITLLVTVFLVLPSPQPAFASAPFDLSQLKQLDLSQLKQIDLSQLKQLDLSQLKQLDLSQLKQFDLSQLKQIDLSQLKQIDFSLLKQINLPQLKQLDLSQLIHIDLSKLIQLDKLLSNKQLVTDANMFLNLSQERVCKAYLDKVNGSDSSAWSTIEKIATSTLRIAQAIMSASAAGAGSLAGYAGIASAVSQLGLGGLTTALAGIMGSSASGAAATAVVTSAVGGPAIMAILLAGGTGMATWGTYELGKFAVEQLGGWAQNYCSLTPDLPGAMYSKNF